MKGLRAVFRDDHTGAEPELWEERWQGFDLATVVRRLAQDRGPLATTLRSWTEPGQRVLEAGCGAGRIVGYLSEIGRVTVGVDFATDTLGVAKKAVPSLLVVGGDVAKLPFPDRSFDVVISLGVIEHFEDGPAPLLDDHRRVVKDDGLLILSVPRLSPLKRVVDFRRLTLARRQAYPSRRGTIVTRVEAPRSTPTHAAQRSAGLSFYQYELSRWWTVTLLRDAGFEPFHAEPIFVSGESLQNPTLIRAGKKLRNFAGRGPTERNPAETSGLRAPTPHGAEGASAGVKRRTKELTGQAMLRFAGRADLVLARPR